MAPAHRNLGELLTGNARLHADRAAFIDGDRALTHAELERQSAALAAGLQRAGFVAGDRLGLLAQNGLGFVLLLAAAARIGVVVSAINWRLSASEVAQVVANDRPTVLFADLSLWPLLQGLPDPADGGPTLATLDGVQQGWPCLDDFVGDRSALKDSPVATDQTAVFIHTAWTDGRPRAAMLTHSNLLAAAAQLRDVWQLGRDDVHWCVLPLFHMTALMLVLATSAAGGCSVLQARFEPGLALEAIARHRASLFAEFAPMLNSLVEQPDAAARLETVRHVCGLDTPETIRRFEALCPRAIFWNGYGQTEAGGMVTLAPFRDADGSVGLPLPRIELQVLDDQDDPVIPGQVGEIALRGPTVFTGYWERADDTARALREGWLHTGDAGRLDDHGRLHYAGRLPAKELIKTGGENVYPGEVRKVLLEHAAVVDAAVIGVPDPRWGESVRAVCVLRAEVDAQTLIDHVGSRIAHFKRPRRIVFVDALPLQADGGHDRDRIKALYGG